MEFPASAEPRPGGSGAAVLETLLERPRPTGPGPSVQGAPDACHPPAPVGPAEAPQQWLRPLSQEPCRLYGPGPSGPPLAPAAALAAGNCAGPRTCQPREATLGEETVGRHFPSVCPSLTPGLIGLLDRAQCWGEKDRLEFLLSWRVGEGIAGKAWAPCHVVNPTLGRRGGLWEHTVGPPLYYCVCVRVCGCW